jgi:hypothetical protein
MRRFAAAWLSLVAACAALLDSDRLSAAEELELATLELAARAGGGGGGADVRLQAALMELGVSPDGSSRPAGDGSGDQAGGPADDRPWRSDALLSDPEAERATAAAALHDRVLADLFGPFAAAMRHAGAHRDTHDTWRNGTADDGDGGSHSNSGNNGDDGSLLEVGAATAAAASAQLSAFATSRVAALARGIPGLDLILKPVMFGALKPIINTVVNTLSPAVMEDVQENLQHRWVARTGGSGGAGGGGGGADLSLLLFSDRLRTAPQYESISRAAVLVPLPVSDATHHPATVCWPC